MSKYAEKHQHVADCDEPGCTEPGTKLARIEAVTLRSGLYWLCPKHFEQYDQRSA